MIVIKLSVPIHLRTYKNSPINLPYFFPWIMPSMICFDCDNLKHIESYAGTKIAASCMILYYFILMKCTNKSCPRQMLPEIYYPHRPIMKRWKAQMEWSAVKRVSDVMIIILSTAWVSSKYSKSASIHISVIYLNCFLKSETV